MNTKNTATLVAIDTETGGAGETQCTTHALLSIGCAAYDAQGYLHTFHQLVLPEPGLIISPEAVAVNGYDREKWIDEGAAVESHACIRLLNWINMIFRQGGKVKRTGLAHNAGHDKGFVEAMLTRQGWRREWEEIVSRRWRCSCAALGFLQDAGTLPAAGGASLDNLTALRTGDTIDNVRAARGIHTADQDALQCLDGYRWLMTLASPNDSPISTDSNAVSVESAALFAVSGTEMDVCRDIESRQQMGIRKYGMTVATNPAHLREWLQHAYEESLDKAIYLKRSIAELDYANDSGLATAPRDSDS